MTIDLNNGGKSIEELSIMRQDYPKSNSGEIPKLIQYHNFSSHPFLSVFKQISIADYELHFPTRME